MQWKRHPTSPKRPSCGKIPGFTTQLAQRLWVFPSLNNKGLPLSLDIALLCTEEVGILLQDQNDLPVLLRQLTDLATPLARVPSFPKHGMPVLRISKRSFQVKEL